MVETNKIILLNDLLKDEVKRFNSKDVEEIKKELCIDVNAKNSNHVIFKRIISSSKKSTKIESLLADCNCVIKTVNLEWNSSLKESMSLSVFKYEDLYNEQWDNSKLRNYFINSTFAFVVFKKTLKSSILEDIKVWHMPSSILESDVKGVWNKTKELITDGKIINYIDKRGRYITFFPSCSETKYVHVRPHAQNKMDTFPLPVKDKLTGKDVYMKHSFWLNNNFIRKIVVEGKYYE